MATSPNYGWLEPDNTDLVKNGALAIRTLGNAIDTTMATMTPKSLVDAKGDLIAATANDTPARLAVGNNGETLVADSSATTGLRYQGSVAGGKNVIINGAMDFWQRGTSTSTANGYGSADRWLQFIASGSGTGAQESTVVPSGFRYAMKFTSATTSTSVYYFQAVETYIAQPLAGSNVVFSAYVASSASASWTLSIEYATTVDATIAAGSWTAIAATSGGTGSTSSTTYTRINGVYAIPSNAKSLRIYVVATGLASGTIAYFSGAQIEVGSVATTFSRAGGTIAGELAACQRYYFRAVSGNAYAFMPANGIGTNSTTVDFVGRMPVTMRVAPTSVDYSTLRCYDNANALPVTNLIISSNEPDATYITATVASGGVQYRPYFLGANNSSTAYLGFSAEL